MRLSHRDFDALQRAILELYECRDLEKFRAAVPAIFLKIIPADYFLWYECRLDLRTKRVRTVDYFESCPVITDNVLERLEDLVFGHPFTTHLMQTSAPTALRLSDFFTATQFQDSTLYQEQYRYFGASRALATAISFTQTSGSSINFHAERKDFTERDRLILNLLRPHFDQAERCARLATARVAAHAVPLEAYGLSTRETELAYWLAAGKTNPEIAIILSISVRTVEKHMERILEKLRVENRTTAAVMLANASEHGQQMSARYARPSA